MSLHIKTLALIFLLLAIPSCTGLPNFLGGGTNVAANLPVGKEVTQQVVANQTQSEDNSTISTGGGGDVKKADDIKEAERDIITTEKLEETVVEKADDVTIINEADSWWVWMFALLGWLMPSPSEITRSISNFILRLAGRDPRS